MDNQDPSRPDKSQGIPVRTPKPKPALSKETTMQLYRVMLYDSVSVEIKASGIDVIETGHLILGGQDGKVIAAFSDWIGCIPMKPLLGQLDTVAGEVTEVVEADIPTDTSAEPIPDEPEGRQ